MDISVLDSTRLGERNMTLNAHCVFVGKGEEEGYLDKLTLDESKVEALRNARDEVRQALQHGLRNWSGVVRKEDLFAAELMSIDVPGLRPKFRMQGSFVYRTCNDPAQTPPQEADLDDGLFLPVSFLSQNGTLHPSVTSKGFFIAVERILDPVCKRNRWLLITDKPSCVRIKISSDAHIDLALYAVPDEEFQELVETAAARAGNSQERVALLHELQDNLELAEDLYRAVGADQIMLAHRDDGWKPSDPRLLEDWFHSAISAHGEQLRRVCRYLKGWRDYQWPACRLASIAVMSAVVTGYQQALKRVPENRDDEALLVIAESLPGIFANAIANPVTAGQRLDEGWTGEQRAEFVAKAKELLRQIRFAFSESDDAEVALATLTTVFGSRIPDDPELISMDKHSAPETKAAALAAPAMIIPTGAEATRRAELAARELENRGTKSKPWIGNSG